MVVNITDYRKDKERSFSPAMDRVLNAFPDSRETSDGWWIHPDNPRFDFQEQEDGRVWIHPWTGRTTEEICDIGGLSTQDLSSKGYFKVKVRDTLSIVPLAHDRCVPPEFLINIGLRDGYAYKGRKYVKMTYFNEDGTPHTKVKIRKALKGDYKHLWDEDTPGNSIPYGLDRLDIALHMGYLFIGEGESDAWACWLHNLPYLGIPGADNQKCYEALNINKLPPKIYILVEPDQMSKMLGNGSGFYKNVHRSLRRLGYKGEIFSIHFAQATGHKDPSDLHKALWPDHEAQGFNDVMVQAIIQAVSANDKEEEDAQRTVTIENAIDRQDCEAVIRSAPDLAILSSTEYAIYKTRIKEKFGKKINLNDLDRAVSDHRKALSGISVEEKLDLDYIASVFTERFRDDWQYDTNIQVWKKWVETHWSEMMNDEDSESELDLIIVDILHEFGFEITRSGILDCVQRLIRAKCKRDFKPTPRRVNFLDGTLNIDTEKLEPHDREDNLPYCLEYPYDSDGDLTNTLAFYTSVLCYPELDANGNKVPDWCAIQTDMAYTGLALMRDMSTNYAEVVKGPPRAGKTTLMRHKNATCGVVNRFAENLEERYGNFGGDDLFSSELEGKRSRYMRGSQRIVCCDELSPNVFKKEEEMLKNMTGHSGVPMRGMLKNEVQNNTWGPKIVMSTNNLPYYKDTSGGIKERLIYVQTPFHLEAKDRDPDLLAKLLDERPAYAKVCIKLAKEMIKQRRFPKSSAMKELAGCAETNGNTLKSFISEKCVLEKTAFLPKRKLYDEFNLYRGDNGNTRDYSLPTMTSNFRDMDVGVHDNNNKSTRYMEDVCKCFFGIRLKTDKELDLEADNKSTTLEDDPLFISLADLGWCNQDVTDCNQDVTVEVTEQDGSASGFSNDCNFVTKKEEKLSYEDTPITINEYEEGAGGIKAIYSGQKTVTELRNTVTQPVEPPQSVTDTSKNGLQSGYKQVTLDDYIDVGF